ncbi:sodium ion-translocating decarboxylase subunit beta [Breznakiellaceae bacterium SP9]
MNIEKKRTIVSIVLKIILIFVIITLNYFFVKYAILNISESISAAIIGGADGPTTIYIAPKFVLKNTVVFSIAAFFILNIITLLVYDIVSLKRDKKYSLKYKIKIVLTIDLLIIMSTAIEIVFIILAPAFLIVLNIVFISILFLKLLFMKNKIREKIAGE